MAEEQTSTREALEAAFADAEKPDAEANTSTDTEAQTETPAPATPATEQPSQVAKEAPKAEEPEIPAPNSWRKETKDIWKQLPKELQAEIARREQDRERYFFRESSRLKNLKEVEEIFQPYINELHARGATPAQVVRQLVAFNNMYEQDPVGTIRQMMQAKGLTVEALQDAAQQADPKYESLTKELQELRAWREQLQQTQEQTAHSATVEMIQAFGHEVGQDGKPLRPYFDEVLPTMRPLAATLKAENPGASGEEILQAAYECALWIHPDVRQKLLDQEVKQREAKRLEEQKELARKARNSAVSVSGAPGGAVSQAQTPQSTREMLEAAFADSAL